MRVSPPSLSLYIYIVITMSVRLFVRPSVFSMARDNLHVHARFREKDFYTSYKFSNLSAYCLKELLDLSCFY